MICEQCANAAQINRTIFNRGGYATYPHPPRCGCACQHRKPAQWDKFFSVEEPGEKDSNDSE